MNENDERYGLLTETSDVRETLSPELQRHLPPATALNWLRAGWRDLMAQPGPSLAYGLAVFLVSVLVVSGLFSYGWGQILFPALAGFLVVGPVLAVGLYQKSRAIRTETPVSLNDMLAVRARSGTGQIFFVGVLLCLVMLLWVRAAVLIYALFFGYRPFPGFDHMTAVLLTTGTGWGMLLTGTIVGGLFASFSFATGAFSIPMLLNERTDAVTAMSRSMALVWNNVPVMLAWGAIVLGLSAIALLTGLLGLIVVFPLLGHATWHAYEAICRPDLSRSDAPLPAASGEHFTGPAELARD
ncbi:DUF2189 domain-containing protein [Aurantimonas sp. VKM B-3413]|uniref:DUF2189 domain-containing protein n=1 Tax=Aurantimonas sp. VKM B-3413 TaxID=2779401 RepID=UPI001E29E137|nr:DUF2189 domain-containing protein [Aurantimonas sp. VKM B-3413]MCB8836785.1 DUF2189 domain-containing protein [Aurantimonas sp. VKM B-3413]